MNCKSYMNTKYVICLDRLVILCFGRADLATNGNKSDLGWAAYGFLEFVML